MLRGSSGGLASYFRPSGETMLHVCCINNGNYLGRGVEYTNILFDMVKRNLPEGFEGTFSVFTDSYDEGYAPGITVRPLPEYLPGWWAKLGLFKPGVFEDGERVLFLDLDTLICGPLDAIAAYDGDFAILRDFYRHDGLQSSVMLWRAGTQQHIWHRWEIAGMPQDPGGDQWWIEQCVTSPDILQDKFPSLFESYKLLRGAPMKASVIVFHGLPRPHEVGGWAAEVWKVGGMTRAELTAVCNTEREELVRNVTNAISLDCEWFDFEEGYADHDGHCVIVGGGPSLASQIESIRQRQKDGQYVWALNNAARFLHENGIRVDVQVILDARPENAAFVHPKAGMYLIASQAHPSVFAAARLYDTVIWHPHTDVVESLVSNVKDKPVHLIGGGTTVGMLAMSLAFLVGYRRIHLYGLDSCYHGPQHHAYRQSMNDSERLLDVVWNDRRYVCAPWMAGQADEFLGLYSFMVSEGVIITAHGEGLIPDMVKHLLLHPVASAADERAHEVVQRLANTPKPTVAEIGVFNGKMSASLLSAREDLKLIMVDSWEGGGAAYTSECGDWHARLTDEQQEEFYRSASRRVQFAGQRAAIIRARSVDAASMVDEVDLAFIDADHSYEGCKADIEAWWPKVRPGGWLGFHDYKNHEFPEWGVTKAVEEFSSSQGLPIETGRNFTAFIRKPEDTPDVRPS